MGGESCFALGSEPSAPLAIRLVQRTIMVTGTTSNSNGGTSQGIRAQGKRQKWFLESESQLFRRMGLLMLAQRPFPDLLLRLGKNLILELVVIAYLLFLVLNCLSAIIELSASSWRV